MGINNMPDKTSYSLSAIRIFICLVFTPVLFISAFGQTRKTNDVDVTRTKITENQFTLTISKNRKLIYVGNFDRPQSLPVGTHFLFSASGKIKKMFEYKFSKNVFESVPNVIQTTYEFSDRQKIKSIMIAERCTECEYTPTGTWKYFNEKGVLVKSIDTSRTKTKLKHPEYEDYWKWISENGL